MRSTHRGLVAAPFVAAIGMWALWRVREGLTFPGSSSAAEMEAWYEQVGAGGAAAVLVWTVGLVVAGWLTTALTLQVLSAWVVGLRGVADGLSPAALRRIAPTVAGLSLSAGIGVVAPSLPTTDPIPTEQDTGRGDTSVSDPDTEGGTATMTRLEPPTSPTTVARSTTSTSTAPTTTSDAPGDEAPPATDEPAPSTTAVAASSPETPLPADAVGPSDPAGAGGPAADHDRDASPDHVASAPPAVPVLVPDLAAPLADRDAHPTAAPRGPEETIIVEPGMSFWSIAEEVLADDGRGTSEREIAHYWRILIDANRDRLIAAGNPDLLLPGQELVLPAR